MTSMRPSNKSGGGVGAGSAAVSAARARAAAAVAAASKTSNANSYASGFAGGPSKSSSSPRMPPPSAASASLSASVVIGRSDSARNRRPLRPPPINVHAAEDGAASSNVAGVGSGSAYGSAGRYRGSPSSAASRSPALTPSPRMYASELTPTSTAASPRAQSPAQATAAAYMAREGSSGSNYSAAETGEAGGGGGGSASGTENAAPPPVPLKPYPPQLPSDMHLPSPLHLNFPHNVQQQQQQQQQLTSSEYIAPPTQHAMVTVSTQTAPTPRTKRRSAGKRGSSRSPAERRSLATSDDDEVAQRLANIDPASFPAPSPGAMGGSSRRRSASRVSRADSVMSNGSAHLSAVVSTAIRRAAISRPDERSLGTATATRIPHPSSPLSSPRQPIQSQAQQQLQKLQSMVKAPRLMDPGTARRAAGAGTDWPADVDEADEAVRTPMVGGIVPSTAGASDEETPGSSPRFPGPAASPRLAKSSLGASSSATTASLLSVQRKVSGAAAATASVSGSSEDERQDSASPPAVSAAAAAANPRRLSQTRKGAAAAAKLAPIRTTPTKRAVNGALPAAIAASLEHNSASTTDSPATKLSPHQRTGTRSSEASLTSPSHLSPADGAHVPRSAYARLSAASLSASGGGGQRRPRASSRASATSIGGETSWGGSVLDPLSEEWGTSISETAPVDAASPASKYGKLMPTPLGAGGHARGMSSVSSFSARTRATPEPPKQASKESLLGSLSSSLAMVDAQQYALLPSLEHVEHAKAELKRSEARIQDLQLKLKVETRVREAATKLRKSDAAAQHSRSPSSVSGTTKVGRASSFSNAAESTGTGEDDVESSTRKIDAVARELVALSEAAGAQRRALLEHQARVLAQRVTQLEEEAQRAELQEEHFDAPESPRDALRDLAAARQMQELKTRLEESEKTLQSRTAAEATQASRARSASLLARETQSKLEAVQADLRIATAQRDAAETARQDARARSATLLAEQNEGQKESLEAQLKLVTAQRDAAEAAKRAADSAKREAEAAKRAAENATREAEAARLDAENATREAQVAQRSAEGAKREAEDAKREAEAGKREVQTALDRTQRDLEAAKREAESSKRDAQAALERTQRELEQERSRAGDAAKELPKLQSLTAAAEALAAKHQREVEAAAAKHKREVEAATSKHTREVESVSAKHAREAEGAAAKHTRELAAVQSQLDRHRADLDAEKSARTKLAAEAAAHAKEASAKAEAERKLAKQLADLEFEVQAERKLMADRAALFLAFEKRLERAEARLRAQDERCARLLGKDEGREEMDDFLAQIKGYGSAKKQKKTAGQDIDALLDSLETHISDMADEMDRRMGNLSNSGELDRSRDAPQAAATSAADTALITELEAELQSVERELERWRSEAESASRQLAALQRQSTASNLTTGGDRFSRSRAFSGDARRTYQQGEVESRLQILEKRNARLEDELAEARQHAANSSADQHVSSGPASPVKVAGSEGEGEVASHGRLRQVQLELGLCRSAIANVIKMLPDGQLQASLLSVANMHATPDLASLQAAFEPSPASSPRPGGRSYAPYDEPQHAEDVDPSLLVERVRALLEAGRAAVNKALSMEAAHGRAKADAEAAEQKCEQLKKALDATRLSNASQAAIVESARNEKKKLESTLSDLRRALDTSKADSDRSFNGGYDRRGPNGTLSRSSSSAGSVSGRPGLQVMPSSLSTSSWRTPSPAAPAVPVPSGSTSAPSGGSYFPLGLAYTSPGGTSNAAAPRSIALGMDTKALVSRVRELERELHRMTNVRKQAERAEELEAKLADAMADLNEAMEELDEVKETTSRQRIQLLEELNHLQDQLATARANLRAEQRKRNTLQQVTA